MKSIDSGTAATVYFYFYTEDDIWHSGWVIADEYQVS